MSGNTCQNSSNCTNILCILVYISQYVQECVEAEKKNIKSNLEKEKRWKYHADFKLYYKVTVIQTVWYWHKNWHRSVEQKSPRNKPRLIESINVRQEGKKIRGKDNLLNSVGKNWTATYKRMKLDQCLYHK